MSQDQDHNGDEDDALIAEYVLGLLDAEQHAALSDRLRLDPALRAEHARWVSRFSALDADFAEVTPPAAGFERVEERLFGAEARSRPARSTFWNSLALWRGLAAVCVVVALLGVALATLRPTSAPTPVAAEQMVAALASPEGTVTYVALFDPETARLRFTTLARPQAPGRDVELWLIHGSEAPHSLGVIPADAAGGMDMPAEMAQLMDPTTVLAITLEPLGGSPSGAPSGPPVATGTVRTI